MGSRGIHGLALLVGLTLAASGRADGQHAADSIRKLDSLWANSYAIHDTLFARALFAEDILITSSSGQIKTREQEIGDVRPSAGWGLDYFRSRDQVVRVRGQTAVVIGVLEWRLEHEGKTSEVRRRYTAVYAPGGPLGWQMVALHIGRAPDS